MVIHCCVGVWCVLRVFRCGDTATTERQLRVQELESTFAVIQHKAEQRQSALEQTLAVAEKFWDNMNGALASMKELEDSLASAEAPALEPDVIRDQQDVNEVCCLWSS